MSHPDDAAALSRPLETAQQLAAAEESPGLKVGIESAKKRTDSSSLMNVSIVDSPLVVTTIRTSMPKLQYYRSRLRLQSVSSAGSSDCNSSASTSSELSSTLATTNKSARSTASDHLSSSVFSFTETTNTNSKVGSDALEESDTLNTDENGEATPDSVDNSEPTPDSAENEERLTPGATENAETSSNSVEDAGLTPDSAEDVGPTQKQFSPERPEEKEEASTGKPQAPEDSQEGNKCDAIPDQTSGTDNGEQKVQASQTDTETSSTSSFDNSFFVADQTQDQPRQKQSSRATGNVSKADMANVIERAILDFCSSRTGDTMRRLFAGTTCDVDDGQRGTGDDRTTTPHLVMGELVKEGIVIGHLDVFGPRAQREFVLPISDAIVTAILKDPQVFRAICHRTHCQIEVTRRILNRKLCVGGSWQKYMILRIIGPTNKSIMTCDAMLWKTVPSYKNRREYKTPAYCHLFMQEDMPDNADLYFNYQRTGKTSTNFGAMKLESPYRNTANGKRNLGSCPWKSGPLRAGRLAFSNVGAHSCMSHVYPTYGYQTTGALHPGYQSVSAANQVHILRDQHLKSRQMSLARRRLEIIPVCR